MARSFEAVRASPATWVAGRTAVSFLALPRTHTGGHNRVLVKERIGAGKWLSRVCQWLTLSLRSKIGTAHNRGSVLAIDCANELLCILTERGRMKEVMAKGLDSTGTAMAKAMSPHQRGLAPKLRVNNAMG